jgi:hypothetical protein
MGFYSKDCHGCGHPALCVHAANDVNTWMTNVVVVQPEGVIVQGEYDGYGKVGKANVMADDGTVWHEACWTKAGRPTEYRGGSTWSADQGWWFTTEHDVPYPLPPTITIQHPFMTCPHCGDDVEVHEWLRVDTCDRV